MGLFDAWANYESTKLTNTANTDMTNSTNAANVAMNEANNAQNKALTEEQWRRDDTATQRRVADLRAAGLNPVLAAGQAAQSSAPIAMSPGRVQAPTHQAAHFQDTFGGAAGTLKTGAEAYKQLVEAKRADKFEKLKLEEQEGRTEQQWWKTRQDEFVANNVLPAEQSTRLIDNAEREWNFHFYRDNNLPSNAAGSGANKFAQVRSLVVDWLKENPNIAGKEVWQAILNMLGGQKGDTK